MSFLKEFRDFAVKGNVIDMAVGLVIGAAFTKIITSLVSDIIMPPIGMVLGEVPFPQMSVHLNADTAIKYGAFISNVVDFLIVAFVIFVVIRQINRLKRPEPAPVPTTRECPYCLSAIPLQATRCACCTSDVEPVAK